MEGGGRGRGGGGRGNRAMREGMGMLLASLRDDATQAASTPPTNPVPSSSSTKHHSSANNSSKPPCKKPRLSNNPWEAKLRPAQANLSQRPEPPNFLGLSEPISSPTSEFDFSAPPRLIHRRRMEAPSEGNYQKRNNFVRSVLWAPDGSCLLATSDDRHSRLYPLSPDAQALLQPATIRCHGDLIYDAAWLPSAPNTSAYATAVRQQPVHLWRAGDESSPLATYRCHNHLDELASVHSLAFSADGRRLLLGLRKQIRLFDSLRPGPTSLSLTTTEKRLGGQSGIISCLAAMGGGSGEFVAGSFARRLGLYVEGQPDVQWAWEAHSGGLTHLAAAPANQRQIVSGARRDGELRLWDLREPGKLLAAFRRPAETNQRFAFSLSGDGVWLVSGDSEGGLRAWDLRKAAEVGTVREADICVRAQTASLPGLSLHPSRGLVATGSGERIFPCPLQDEEALEMDNCLTLWEAPLNAQDSVSRLLDSLLDSLSTI